MMRSALRTALGVLCATALATGCGKDTTSPGGGGGGGGGGGTSNGLNLAVAVRLDPSTFPTTGEFDLALIPSDSQGVVLVSEPWTIKPTVSAPTGVAPSLLSQEVSTPDTRPFAMAIDMDNSSSIELSDPDRQRVTAANLLWHTLLTQTPGSQASLLYFGLENVPPSPGFTYTRILQSWTSDTNQLAGKFDTLQVLFGSPLYGSALEAALWVDSTVSASQFQRGLTIITDGEPTDTSKRAAVIAAAQASGIPIFTVGLGAASSSGSKSQPAAVAKLQELANETGGVYASAPTPDQLTPVLQSLAVSTTTGALIAHLKVSPVPATGSGVVGAVTLVSPVRGSVSGTWTFKAP